MKRVLLAVFLVYACTHIFSQVWQPMGIPEGSGITDLVYWKGSSPFDDKLWATTGSVNWPTGQRGGVFYSATTPPYEGTWYRIGGSAGWYIGRTLAVGQDGNLYASLWRDPASFPADGLFRFVPQAATFGLLYQAQAGDNIFSIAVKNNPHTIFAGTRNGIIRSTDNGTIFVDSNTGIPDSAWVFDIAIDSTGILASASSKGLFISTDNGNNWQQAAGIPPGDTIKSLLFYNEITEEGGNSALMSGSKNGQLYVSTADQLYLNAAIVYSFFQYDEEIAEIAEGYLYFLNRKKHGIALFKYGVQPGNRVLDDGGGFYLSSDNGISWLQENNGLPPNPPVSALAVKNISQTIDRFFTGLFNDTTNGAGVYRMDMVVDAKETENEIPSEYFLSQNYPNPFNPSTTIQFSIPEQTFVTLEIFNTLGEKITTLVSKELNAGNHKYEWNPGTQTGGIYFYKLSTSSFEQTKKLVLMK